MASTTTPSVAQGSAANFHPATSGSGPVNVRAAYANKTVLITGTTGFVGKVVLEKLLFSNPEIRRIYLMVRPRKGQSSQERLQSEILQSRCFDRLREKFGSREAFDRHCQRVVFAFEGELTLKRLGIKDDVWQQLTDEVEIIIHCAASVNFHERLDRAVELNTLGGSRVMQLAKACKHLRARGCLVHVSTCFVNCDKPTDSRIDEKVYRMGFDVSDELRRIRSMTQGELANTQTLTATLRGYPNTYTFTKAMGENLLVEQRGDLPMAIVRPAIVTAKCLLQIA